MSPRNMGLSKLGLGALEFAAVGAARPKPGRVEGPLCVAASTDGPCRTEAVDGDMCRFHADGHARGFKSPAYHAETARQAHR